MQETAPVSRRGNGTRLCERCRAAAQLRTPSGSYCPYHAYQIYFREAEITLPDWIPWVIHSGDTATGRE
ncbi:MAG: hypothetical protein WB239_15045 [Acidimicrobiia bacterium]